MRAWASQPHCLILASKARDTDCFHDHRGRGVENNEPDVPELLVVQRGACQDTEDRFMCTSFSVRNAAGGEEICKLPGRIKPPGAKNVTNFTGGHQKISLFKDAANSNSHVLRSARE